MDCRVAPGGLVQGAQGNIPTPQAGLAEALPIQPLLPGAGGCAQVPASRKPAAHVILPVNQRAALAPLVAAWPAMGESLCASGLWLSIACLVLVPALVC